MEICERNGAPAGNCIALEAMVTVYSPRRVSSHLFIARNFLFRGRVNFAASRSRIVGHDSACASNLRTRRAAPGASSGAGVTVRAFLRIHRAIELHLKSNRGRVVQLECTSAVGSHLRRVSAAEGGVQIRHGFNLNQRVW